MHRHGAHLLDATSARFALWAPDARSVSVELEQQPAIELLPDDDAGTPVWLSARPVTGTTTVSTVSCKWRTRPPATSLRA